MLLSNAKMFKATSQFKTLDDAIESFLIYGKAKNLSNRTIEFYTQRLKAFRHYIDNTDPDVTLKAIVPAFIRQFILDTRDTSSAATANHNINVLRNFFGFLMREGIVEDNPALAVQKQRQVKKIINTFTIEQLQALLATCDKSFYGLRDKAIMLTLLDTGVRVQELTRLKIDGISWSEQTLLVLGKGSKERQVPFGLGVRKALNEYIIRRGKIENQELVFVTHYGESMGRNSVRTMLRMRAEKAGVTGVRVSSHTFRHTFAKQWLLNGGDAFSLQKVLGHTTLDMVRNYVNLAQEDVKVLHRRFSPVDAMKPDKSIRRKRIR